MQIHYLEIVTRRSTPFAPCTPREWGAVRQAGHRAGQRTDGRNAGRRAGGGRAPLRETEEPVVRPYWLVDNIERPSSRGAGGGTIAHPPMEIPGHGTFAIYLQGGITMAFGRSREPRSKRIVPMPQ